MDHIHGNLKTNPAQSPLGSTAHLPQAKTYQTKANATGDGSSDLGVWYEQAYAYYNDVLSGAQPMPDEASWNDFLSQMDWAKSQLFGSGQGGFDPAVSGSSDGDFNSGGFSAPDGAYVNQQGEYIYDTESAHIFYNGDPTTVHSFATDNRLDIPSMAARVEMVVTKDDETGGRDILKVKITYADGSEKILTFDNYDMEDFSLDIHAANMDNVSIPDALKDKVHVQKFQAQDENTTPQATLNGKAVQGEAMEGVENGTYYEAGTVLDVFEFRPTAGENEVNFVVGSWDLSIPLSSEAHVYDSDNPNYDYKIEVVHSDGSTDTYYVQDKDEFHGNINGLKDNIHFHTAGSDDLKPGKVPAELKDHLSLNAAGASEGDPSAGDTPYDDISENGMFGPTATYNTQETVNLTFNSEDEANTHMIFAQNFNLNVGNFQNEVSVTKQSDGSYLITVKGDGGTELYYVDGQVKSITINGGKVTLDESVQGDEKIQGPGIEVEAADSSAEVPEMIQDLAKYVGKSVDTIMMEINDRFEYVVSQYDKDGDKQLSGAELQAAIDDGAFPPEKPDQALLEFIAAIDDEFQRLLDKCGANQHDAGALTSALTQASDRLVDMLRTLYPDKASQITFSPGGDWKNHNNIKFGDINFQYTSETDGSRGLLDYQEY